MVLTFTQTIPPALEEMETALKNQQWDKLARVAHQIKPSFSLMGLNPLRTNILFIEENSKANTKLDEIPRVVSEFVRQCNAVLPQLAKEASPV